MHPRFQTAFAQLADNLQSALEPILADKYFPALLTGEQVSSLKSATGLDEDALLSHCYRWLRPVRVRHCRILTLALLHAA